MLQGVQAVVRELRHVLTGGPDAEDAALLPGLALLPVIEGRGGGIDDGERKLLHGYSWGWLGGGPRSIVGPIRYLERIGE
ncbi:hypothetical protein GCM10009648_36380 [Tsukamurella spumae]